MKSSAAHYVFKSYNDRINRILFRINLIQVQPVAWSTSCLHSRNGKGNHYRLLAVKQIHLGRCNFTTTGCFSKTL